MPHPDTPESVLSGLLWGSIICSYLGSFFVGVAFGKLLKNGAGDGKHALASFCALFAGSLFAGALFADIESFLTTYPHVAWATGAMAIGLGFGFDSDVSEGLGLFD